MAGFDLKTVGIITNPADLNSNFVFFGAPSQGASAPVLISFSALPSGGGAGVTNLSLANQNATTFDILSSTGTDVTLPAATTTLAGLMAAADKTNLEALRGGTTGQIISKTSGADFAFTWVDDPGIGTAIGDAPTVTPGAGDFIPFLNNDNTPAKVEATYFAAASSLGALATLSSVGSTQITDAAVTYAKIQNVAANSVLARAANSSGVVSAIAIGASQLFGRGATGDLVPITLGTNLSMSGATLNATGGGGGETSQLPPRSGAWFGSGSGTGSAAVMGSSGRIFYVPLLVPASMTIDRIGINVQTGAAATNAKLGIYNSDANRLPSTLNTACAAAISTATSGLKEGTFSSNPTLAAGLYYLAWQTDSAGFTLQPYVVHNAADFWIKNSIGTTNYGGSEVAMAQDGISYASGLPATATPTINVGGWFYPVMTVRQA